ncbi:hypothetical protein [Methylobacterium sp. A54F]
MSAPLRAGLRRWGPCARGAAAVQMALLAWPTLFIVVGIFQFILAQYVQVLLNNHLHNSAAQPEAALLAGSQRAYKTLLCARIAMMPAATCTAALRVEQMTLASAPTAVAPITGGSFAAGAARDVMLLRAALPVPMFLPLIPQITARSSVTYRRP